MKNYILSLCAIALIFVGCKQNEPAKVQAVTFHVQGFQQTTEPMRAPAATILDDENGTALTDIFIFDGTTQAAHQTSDDPDFGTLTLNLTHGSHSLSFIATRSTGLTYENGILSMTSVRSTFCKPLALTVSSATGAQDVTLDRLNGALVLTINDAFPANAAEIEFVINPRYSAINVTNFRGVNGASWNQRVSCTSKVGQTGVQYTFNHFAPRTDEEYTADVTLNVYNTGGTVIHSVTIDDVRLATNTKTLLSGNLFAAPSASISVSHTWNSNIVGTW